MDNNIKDFEQIHAELKGVGVELFAWDEILAIVRLLLYHISTDTMFVGQGWSKTNYSAQTWWHDHFDVHFWQYWQTKGNSVDLAIFVLTEDF